MGSHSKKRKKDRRRSRSRSNERHRSKHKSRSRSRSRSPSYRSSSSKYKKQHRRSRSRSPSKRSRRSRSRSLSRSRRSSRSRSWSRERSRSRSKERLSKRSRRSRSKSLPRRSRSRSAERRRRRSRSTERSSRSKRSKSRERQKSPERSSARSSRGGSQDSAKVKNEKDSDDNEDSTDQHLNPAEAIHRKMRKALEAAASADAKLREQGLLSSVKQELLTPTEQLERDQKMKSIESDSFAPSAFVSNRDRPVAQPVSYLTQEQTHENAIFGGVGVPNPALNGGQVYSYGIPMTYKKRGQLASKYLSESIVDKEKRWLEKLQAMRKQKLEANPDYFNKLLTINADSPSRE